MGNGSAMWPLKTELSVLSLQPSSQLEREVGKKMQTHVMKKGNPHGQSTWGDADHGSRSGRTHQGRMRLHSAPTCWARAESWGHLVLGTWPTVTCQEGHVSSHMAAHSSSPVDKLLIPWGLGTHFWVWTPEELSYVYNRGCVQERSSSYAQGQERGNGLGARQWEHGWIRAVCLPSGMLYSRRMNELQTIEKQNGTESLEINLHWHGQLILNKAPGQYNREKKVSSTLVQLNIHMKKLTPASYHRRHRNEHKVDNESKYKNKKTRE